MARKSTPKLAKEFTDARDFIRRYTAIDDDDLNVVTVWTMGTWCFSPACTWPVTYPYLYVTAQAGAGKTVLCQDAIGSLARDYASATGATGPTLFRMLGMYDEETGEVDNFAPTLFMDEIDATFSGSKDEPLRLSLNVGYKRGATIPRSMGKTTIRFPVYGPKMMAGIDNGHLPETVVQRSIRIELTKKTQDELTEMGVESFFVFDVEDEATELQIRLSEWAKENSNVLREYRPNPPKGLSARQWEIARSLVQLSHAIGNETEIIKSLVMVMNRNVAQQDAKKTLYTAIKGLFDELDIDRVTTRQIVTRLTRESIAVPGQSGTGLSKVLRNDRIEPTYIRLTPSHPDWDPARNPTQRGYYRHYFDGAFLKYLKEDEDN